MRGFFDTLRGCAAIAITALGAGACGGTDEAVSRGSGDTEPIAVASDALLLATGPALAVGSWHSCAVMEGGFVKCWGDNSQGQLGLGNTVSRGNAAGTTGDGLPFVQLGTGLVAKSVVAGSHHSCVLFTSGQVKCWGYGAVGTLGLGDTKSRGGKPGEMGSSLPFVDLGTGVKAKALTAGAYHTCALLSTNQVKCWGWNQDGQLGLGDADHRGDNPGEMGDSLPAVDLGSGRSAKAVSSGYLHTCALLDNDQVKCWGHNGYGQLGLGDTNSRGTSPAQMGDNLVQIELGAGRIVKAIASGAVHTCALLDNGQIKCWGFNGSGELGLGDADRRGVSTGQMGDNLPAVALGTGRRARAVFTGDQYSCALLDNYQVKCWGLGSNSELGLGDRNSRGRGPGQMGDALPAVELGSGFRVATFAASSVSHHTCVGSSTRQVKCWGHNTAGQLGLGDTQSRGGALGQMGDNLPRVDLGSRSVKALSAGTRHTCAVLYGNQVKCWGDNASGQLGIGNQINHGDGNPNGGMGEALPAVDLGSGRTVKAIQAGSEHNCAILDTNQVKCWGRNAEGQLGVGDSGWRGPGPSQMGDALPAVNLGAGRSAKALAGSGLHTCAILDNDQVKCWGWNRWGQLGLGDTNNRGTSAAEMGDNLPFVNLGSGRSARALAAAGTHTCAVLDNGQIKCWGWNQYGRLGLGDTADRGMAPGQMGDSLPAVDLGPGRTAKQIATSDESSCALLDNNQVKCWGRNHVGQLGQGDTLERGDGVGFMGASLPAIDLGVGRSVKAIHANGSFSCALLNTNHLKCWGGNVIGQLGLGDTTPRGRLLGEMGDALATVRLGYDRTVKLLSTGGAHACALLNTNQVKCWGWNTYGQLGLGDTAHRGMTFDSMGDGLPVVNLGLEP